MKRSPLSRNYSLTAIPAVLALTLLLVAACSDDDPAAPEPTPLPSVSGTLGASGGTLTSSDGSLELTVPPGALAADAEISIAEVEEDQLADIGAGMQVLRGFKMAPAGLAFAVPAVLTLDLDLPVPAKIRVRKEAVPVAVVTDDMEELPQGRSVQEYLELTIDQNAAPATGVLYMRGVTREAGIVMPVSGIDPALIPAVTTLNDWNEAPKEQETFANQVSLETSGGLNLIGSVTYSLSESVNLTTNLNDGDELAIQTEGETTGGGYLRNFAVDYLPGSAGAAMLKFAMTYELGVDFAYFMGDSPDVPLVNGTTKIHHILEDIDLTVESGDTGGELVGVGLYDGEAAAEAITLLRELPGNRYNDSILASGGEGTRIRGLSRTNPLAVLSNRFHAQGLTNYGAFVVREGADAPVTAGLTYFQYGSSGMGMSQWDEGSNDFGWSQLGMIGHNVTDGQPYVGGVFSGGAVLTDFTAGQVSLFEWDAANTWFNLVGSISSFPGAEDPPVTAAVHPDGGALVVIDGFPGAVYYHDRMDYFAAATYLGDVGDSPRRLRFADGLGVISNNGSDNLSVLMWDGSAMVDFLGTVPVGDGPVGVDIMALGNGNLAVASTGFNDNTYTITILSSSGAVISNVTTAMPAGAEGPGHAAWMHDPDNLLLISNNISGNIAVVDPGLP